jgi:uroporphyrinogen-III synthase
VNSFVELAGPEPKREAWQTVPAACIGEITADTASLHGFQHILTARPSTIPGLVQAIVDHATGARQGFRDLEQGSPALSNEE